MLFQVALLDVFDTFALFHLFGEHLFILGGEKVHPANLVEVHTDGVVYNLLFL